MKKIILLVMTLGFLFGAERGPSLVEVAVVQSSNVNPLQEFTGSIELTKQGDIASQTSAKVLNVFFSSAQSVKKGDVLVTLDSEVLDIQLKKQKQNVRLKQIILNNAKKDLDRFQELRKANSVSIQNYDNALFKYESNLQDLEIAKTSLKELEIQKSYKTIKAPYDGVVLNKNVEIGEWVSVGNNVAKIMNENEISLLFNLPSSYTYKLDKNTKYSAIIQGQKFEAKLVGILPKGDKRTRTFQVKFQLANDKINLKVFDGMETKIKLPRDKKIEALVVPRDAVISKFGQNVVFANNDKKALMLPVKVISYLGDKVAIEAQGLKSGMEIVTKGNERIFPNSPIQPINNKK